MRNLWQDLRFAVRMLVKSPGMTVVAVLTLALGIGANTAIFSLVNSFLLRPMPVPHAEQIAYLTFETKDGTLQNNFSVPEFQDIQRGAGAAFSDVFGYQIETGGLTIGKETAPVTTNYVTGNFFSGLGLQPELGRFISENEGNVAEITPVIVLGYSCWKTRFGGDPNVVGRSVLYDGRPMTVIGVVKREFHGPYALLDTQVYLPTGNDDGEQHDAARLHDESGPALRSFVRADAAGGGRSGGAAGVARAVGADRARISEERNGNCCGGVSGAIVAAVSGSRQHDAEDCDAVFDSGGAGAGAGLRERGEFFAGAGDGAAAGDGDSSGDGRIAGRLIQQLLTESLVLALAGGLAGVLVGMLASGFAELGEAAYELFGGAGFSV